MWDLVQGYAADVFGDLADPRKRIFWGYLASAWLIAFLWLYFRHGASFARALGEFFSPASWLTRSAFADYMLLAINGAVMMLIAPALLSQLTIAFALFQWMHGWFDGRPVVDLPAGVIMAWFTITLFIMDDLARYWMHRLLHRIPALWAFHKVHHTATSLNPLTVFRTHPVEGVLFSIRGALVQGVCVAPFIFFFGDDVALATVLGASAATFAFNALGSNLRHSHIALGYWRVVERVLISPAQHQVHHSMAHRHVDRNFGATFALWDWLFGTHCHSETDRPLVFGVRGENGPHAHRLSSLYWSPFAESLALARRAWGRAPVMPRASRITRASDAAGAGS